MVKITSVKGRQVFDSRGNPTVECDIYLEDNSFGRAAVPSGASTGMHEAVELRDHDLGRFNGKGVQKAIYNILEIVYPKIINKIYKNIYEFDDLLISIDGTSNKSKLGANATLALSLAYARALSNQNKKELFVLPLSSFS